MSVVPQQCHKTKPQCFQFQDQDSSSTQSTGQSSVEVGSAQPGICTVILSISLILNFLFLSIGFCHIFLL